MEGDRLQCMTLSYPITNAATDLQTLTWGAPVFRPRPIPTDPPEFIGIVAQEQPAQNEMILDQGKIMLRVVTHGMCVAPAPVGHAYTITTRPGKTSGGWPHDPVAGGVRVLGVQHESHGMGTLYRLLVRADALCHH